jgi:hypothetical protein
VTHATCSFPARFAALFTTHLSKASVRLRKNAEAITELMENAEAFVDINSINCSRFYTK